MLVVVAMVLAGCNTMNGVGKDMEKAGEAVQRKSSQ
jgi:entericidin B